MKIIISGSENFTDKDFLFTTCLDIISEIQYKHEVPLSDVEILSGHNPKGADYYGERFATAYGVKLKLFPANWNDITALPVIVRHNFYGPYNALAGRNRNEQMVQYATQGNVGFLIAFSVDKDSGTKHLTSIAKKYGIQVFLYEFEKDPSGKLIKAEKKKRKKNEKLQP